MKKTIVLTIILLTSMIIIGQNVNTMWPYLFTDFTEGTIYTKDGLKFHRKVNIHVLKSTLHYLDNNVIKETSSSDLLFVDVADTKFMCVDGKVMQVVKGDSEGFVATLVMGDFSKVVETGGAYGSSSNALATTNLSSVDIGGINVINHMQLRENRAAGKTIPIMTSYYIVTGGNIFPAVKNKIKKMLSGDKKKDFKDIIKKHKIKWSNPDDLMYLVDFLKEVK